MKFLSVMSGKGGVGKTTVAINLAAALNAFGRSFLLLDANLTTPNMGLHLGSPKLPVTLHDVLLGKNDIKDAIYLHPSGLKLIPSDISIDKMKDIDPKRLKQSTEELRKYCEVVVVDSVGGLNDESRNVMKMSDEVILVTHPDMPSAVDALKTKKMAEEAGATVIGAVINQHRGEDTELPASNVESFLGVPVIAVIPESVDVRESLKVRYPVVLSHPDSDVAIAFKRLAALLIGQRYEPSVKAPKKEGAFASLWQKLKL